VYIPYKTWLIPGAPMRGLARRLWDILIVEAGSKIVLKFLDDELGLYKSPIPLARGGRVNKLINDHVGIFPGCIYVYIFGGDNIGCICFLCVVLIYDGEMILGLSLGSIKVRALCLTESPVRHNASRLTFTILCDMQII